MSTINALSYVLGGGAGERLFPLTSHRAKPAVPFGANYRVIDFVLSNLYHSSIRKIYVLTQHESHSLHRHIKYGWYPRFGVGGDEFLTVLPSVKGGKRGWYDGTAEAITKNLEYITEEDPEVVDVFGADHIYFMDISKFNEYHLNKNSDLTICTIPVKRDLAKDNYGVLEINENWEVINFEEKPLNPKPIPNNEEYCLTSMGNYVFNPQILIEQLLKDSEKEFREKKAVLTDPNKFSTHDFGFDIIPAMIKANKKVFAYNFNENTVRGSFEIEKGFWRDIGSLDEYYKVNMEVRSINPPINLYNQKWPVHTCPESLQPAKFVNNGKALDSIIANGVIISNSFVNNSVIGYSVIIESSEINNSILLGNNKIGEGSRIEKTIIDKNINVPYECTIGIDKELDKKRGLFISKEGITIIPKFYKFE